jgi:RNase P/RNase MRP subunit POP5
VSIRLLRRRDKRRYILLYTSDETLITSKGTNKNDLHNFIRILRKRFYELFGSIELEKAGIHIISKNNFYLPKYIILKCNLASIESVLFAISLAYPPSTTIKISGTLKKLTSSTTI